MKVISGGHEFELPSSSSMAWRVAFTGDYDRAEIAFVSRFIEPGTAVLDIGASLGLWTVPLAIAARERGGRVIAFEPLAGNIDFLRLNIALNGLEQAAIVHHTALGSSAGRAFVEAECSTGNAVIAAEGEGRIEVPIGRLDDFSLPPRVSFIKLDVEGFEVEVLRGAMGLIARDRPVIFGEFNSVWIERRGTDLGEALKDFSELGYEIHQLQTTRVRPWLATRRISLRRLRDANGAENLLLRPSSA